MSDAGWCIERVWRSETWSLQYYEPTLDDGPLLGQTKGSSLLAATNIVANRCK